MATGARTGAGASKRRPVGRAVESWLDGVGSEAGAGDSGEEGELSFGVAEFSTLVSSAGELGADAETEAAGDGGTEDSDVVS